MGFVRTYCVIAVFFVASSRLNAQFGHILDAVGPVNQSMGGAGVALPLDAMGALHWNPASISWLEKSEIGFGLAGFAAEIELASGVDANAFGPGVPNTNLRGRTKADSEINPIPSMGIVCHEPNSNLSYGLGGYAIGGFGVSYPLDPNNPILTPQPPDGGIGFGAIYSQFQLLQFSPTVAIKVSDTWSVGFAPTFNWASWALDPFAAAAPNANGAYPWATHADVAWGLGFQVGAMYRNVCSGLSLGFSYKSPQWFQDFKFNSQDDLGNPRTLTFNLDYPSIVTFGLGWQGHSRVSAALDVRYVDYSNTDGFGAWGFNNSNAVDGFGWNSIWVVSSGIQYLMTDRLALRFGYTYNESPISSRSAFFNTPAPGIIQHHLSTGFSYDTNRGWDSTMTFHYRFENTTSGSWYSTLGPVPGTSVRSYLTTYTVSAGFRKRF